MRAPTPQTLDPLGGLNARYFLLASCVLTGLVAAIMAAYFANRIDQPLLQIAALVALLVALVQAIAAADPRNFPYSVGRHIGVFTTLVLAAAVDAASRPDGAGQVGVWGPICIAIMLFLSGSFRPAFEIAIVTTLVAAAVTGIMILHLGDITGAPAVLHVARGVMPIIAIGSGTAAFSHVQVKRISAWQRTHQLIPPADPTAAAEAQRVRRDFVDYRVGPFLEAVLASGELTPVDAARARGLAAGLRQQMLRDAARTWLSHAVDHFDGDRDLVEALNPEQRRVLGALVAELRTSTSLVEGSIAATATAGPPGTIELTATLDTSTLRAPVYRAVLGSVFPRSHVDVLPDGVTIVAQLER